MTRHLCISVTLLDPLFHGKGDGDLPEWPPSPMRLFQALLAGSRAGCRNLRWNTKKAEAFRWLERQGPPIIVAPPARPAKRYDFFVPNNDADKTRESQKTTKRAAPHILLEGNAPADAPVTIHYLWEIPEAEWPRAEPHATLLCREARNLVALGWGVDQAVGNGEILANGRSALLRGQRWEPWRNAPPHRPRLRLPRGGTLDDLEGAYRDFENRIRVKRLGRRKAIRFTPPRRPRCFETIAYLPSTNVPPRHYAVFELPDGVAFRQEEICIVAAMLRSLVCREENRRDFAEQFPDANTEVYLAGHVGNTGRTPPRFSYLPLPTIGHEHADGMIRRVMIVEPYGGDGSRARWAERRLAGQALRDNDGNARGVLMVTWRSTSTDMISRYAGENSASREWATVTPVILPGFDSRDRRRGIPPARRDCATRAERLFLRAVQQAGIPQDAVESFAMRKAPYWPGSLHPDCYRRPDYLDAARNRRFPAWHVWIRFREAVPGPVSIGAGRHCGLGLFAVWSPTR